MSLSISPTSTAHISTSDLITRACSNMSDVATTSAQPMRRSESSNTNANSSRCEVQLFEGIKQENQPNKHAASPIQADHHSDGNCEAAIKEEKDAGMTPNGTDLEPAPASTSIKMVIPPWNGNDGWSGWMSDTVTAKSLVLCLILQAFSTGILDATTYLDFSTFASNQTGNTILLTVAVVKVSGHQLLLTGISLASFLSAALVFGHIGHYMGVRRRIWLLINVICQIIFLVLATIFLSSNGPKQTRLGEKHEWVIISLFAIMSGAQVAAARQASIQEIPTAPMTSSYVDLVSDKYLFVGLTHEKASGRNRRLIYILSMIIGSFIGGIMHKYAGSWVVVVVAMSFKLAVLGLMSIAPAEIIVKKEMEKKSKTAC